MAAPAKYDATRGRRLPRGERRAQLLDAAQRVFAASGYHAAAMDDIADTAGVSKPVLYQHFPGKLELYLALLDAHTDTLVQVVRDAVTTPQPDNKSRVFATVAAFFDFVASTDGGYRMIFESDLTGEAAVRERIDAVQDICAQTIAEAVVADTGLQPDSARLVGVAMAGIAQVTARDWLTQGCAMPKDEAADLVGQIAWRGLRGLGPTPTTPPPLATGA